MTPPEDDDALPPLRGGLLEALLGADAPEEPPPPVNPQIARAVSQVLDALISDELLELDEGLRPNLSAELATVVGEARSPKDFVKRFVRTIVHSDHVEEIYATDGQLADVVKKTMEP